MFQKISGNAAKDSGLCYERFRGIFKRILRNLLKDTEEKSMDMDICLTGTLNELFIRYNYF